MLCVLSLLSGLASSLGRAFHRGPSQTARSLLPPLPSLCPWFSRAPFPRSAPSGERREEGRAKTFPACCWIVHNVAISPHRGGSLPTPWRAADEIGKTARDRSALAPARPQLLGVRASCPRFAYERHLPGPGRSSPVSLPLCAATGGVHGNWSPKETGNHQAPLPSDRRVSTDASVFRHLFALRFRVLATVLCC